MSLFKKIKESPTFFEDESLDAQFDRMMEWMKHLSRKDFNKVKKAIDKGYDAYQILHGIEPDDDTPVEDDLGVFMTSDKEGE